uniref:Uncharacterized protein n=1 Tax=Arundo donax TaxID=35708 RepID=A0A0A9CBT8_ARUDO
MIFISCVVVVSANDVWRKFS